MYKRQAGTYFGLETKYMRRIAELTEGGFTIFIGNKYMICLLYTSSGTSFHLHKNVGLNVG